MSMDALIYLQVKEIWLTLGFRVILSLPELIGKVAGAVTGGDSAVLSLQG